MGNRLTEAQLRGLLWFAWHEFNAIRARSGAPLDQYGMLLCTHEWWDTLTMAFKDAIGEEATTPWPSPEAKPWSDEFAGRAALAQEGGGE